MSCAAAAAAGELPPDTSADVGDDVVLPLVSNIISFDL